MSPVRLAFLVTVATLALSASAAAQDLTGTTWAAPVDASSERAEQGSTSTVDLEPTRETTTSLADELDKVPSADVRSAGGVGAPSYVSLRGSEPFHVRFVLDGIPLHGAHATSFDLSSIPVELLGRMTVYRSNVPVQLGAPLPGGLVHLETRFDANPAPRVSLAAGSFGTRRALVSDQFRGDATSTLLSLAYSGANNRFRFFDDGGTPFNADDDTESRRRNAHVDQVHGLVRHRVRLGGWRLTALALGGFETRGVPGLATVQTTETSLVGGRGFGALRAHRPRWLHDDLDLELVAGGSVAYERYRDPDDELGLGAQDLRTWSWLALASARPTYWFGEASALKGVFDVQLEGYGPRDDSTDLRVDGARRTTLGAGTEVTSGVWEERITGEVGARSDLQLNQVDGDPNLAGDSDRSDRVLWSPHIGLAIEPWQQRLWSVQAYATASLADRAPGFFELYGDRGATAGNPELRSERRLGYDVGLRFGAEVDDLSTSVSWGFFDRRVEDLIVFVENGLGVAVPRNIDDAALRGHELGLALAWRGQFRVSASYLLLDALNRTGGSETFGLRLPNRPEHQGDVEVAGGTSWLQARYGLDAAGSFYLDDRELRPMPGRVTHEVGLQVRPPLGWRPVIDVVVRNLGDLRTEDVELPDGGELVSTPRAVADVVGYPLPGRSVFVTLSVRPGSAP